MVGRALAHLRERPADRAAEDVGRGRGRVEGTDPGRALSETGRALCAYGDGLLGPSVRRARKEERVLAELLERRRR
jgi:hypothetical protein